MQYKAFFLALCCIALLAPSHGAGTKSSTLNRALSAALRVSIVSGQYAQIYNKWIGVGNFNVPSPCDATFPDAGVLGPSGSTFHGGSLQTVIDKKLIVFGATAQVFPFTFAASPDGYIRMGANYDLAVALAQILSARYNVVITAAVKAAVFPNGFSDASAAVQLGVYDAVLDLIIISNSVKQVVAPTCAYFLLQLGMLESVNQSPQINTYNDLNSGNYTVGYVLGSVGQDFVINNLPGVQFSNKIAFSSASALRNAATGKTPVINVAIDYKPLIQYYVQNTPSALARVPNTNLFNPQPIAMITAINNAGRIACATALAVVLTILATLL